MEDARLRAFHINFQEVGREQAEADDALVE
jgi:hypothetical protein